MRQDYQQNGGGQQPLFAPTTMYPNPYLIQAPVAAGGAVAPVTSTAMVPYPPPPPYVPYPTAPAVVPVGPMAGGPYWMPYSPPVVVRPIVVPRFSVNLVVPFR
jgi:hypothetical protein